MRSVEGDGQMLVRVGRPATVLVEMARDQGYDLLVVGTHGRKGIEHVILGSVAERVVRSATVPVLVVKAG